MIILPCLIWLGVQENAPGWYYILLSVWAILKICTGLYGAIKGAIEKRDYKSNFNL